MQDLDFEAHRDPLRLGQRNIVNKTKELRSLILGLDEFSMRPPLAPLAGMENRLNFNDGEICSDPDHPQFALFSDEFTLVHLKRFSAGHVLKFRKEFFEVTAWRQRSKHPTHQAAASGRRVRQRSILP